MKPLSDIRGGTVRLLEQDVDTDQMIPARFLRTAASSGLGPYLFYDRRFAADGSMLPDFPLNPPSYNGEPVLLAGANFGCGSSREHAPWALLDYGIKAIIAPSFADIFFNNCLKNGLLAVTVDPQAHARLVTATGDVTVSLARQQIEAADFSIGFTIDPFSRFCLLEGLGQLDYILKHAPTIAAFEREHHARYAPIVGLQ